MPTNAERQRRYRDRKRGGPPIGRWGGSKSTAAIAKQYHISRTMVFMGKWILAHAPDAAALIDRGELKTTPTYKRLRREYVLGIAEALRSQPRGGKAKLTESRRDGRFVFQWVEDEA